MPLPLLAGAVVAPLVGELGEILNNVIDKIWPDKEKAEQAKMQAALLLMQEQNKIVALGAQVVVAEAQSEHWLEANWRPMTMMVFVFLIVHQFIIAPYLFWMGMSAPQVLLPADVWSIIYMGLGGYVVGRTVEKVVPQTIAAVAQARTVGNAQGVAVAKQLTKE